MEKDIFAKELAGLVEKLILSMPNEQYLESIETLNSILSKNTVEKSGNNKSSNRGLEFADCVIVNARIRHCEEAEVNGEKDISDAAMKIGAIAKMPCMVSVTGKYFWRPIINVKTGQIVNWEKGKTANTYYKVVDECGWTYQSKSGKTNKEIVDYVPDFLCPDDEGWGDYMDMTIDKDGYILGWSEEDARHDIREKLGAKQF